MEAYRQCVDARLSFIRAVNGAPKQFQDEAHDRLHLAVLEFYEVVRYKLATIDSVEKFWNERPVFGERVTKYARNEKGQLLVDENGNPLTAEKEQISGLKQLDSWLDSRRTETIEIEDSFGKRTIEREVSDVLSPGILMECAHALEEAVDKMGLLAAVDASTPRTEITKEHIEEVERWERQNLE